MASAIINRVLSLDSKRADADPLDLFTKKVANDLRARYTVPKNPRSSRGPFINPTALREVIDEEVITKLFCECTWYQDGYFNGFISRFLSQVLGILITIQWAHWDEFKRIFIDPKDQAGRPLRGDYRLPFARTDLSFIKPATHQKFFEDNQYVFCPLVIIEDAHIQCPEQIRPPFLSSEPLREGGFGAVTRECIERGQVIYSSGQSRGQSNNERVYMARKVIVLDERSRRSFDDERRILEKIKQGTTSCKAIAVSFATFVHGNTLNILSPLADIDLFDFMRGNYEEFPQKASAFTPNHLFEQARCIANALRFLHTQLDIGGEFSCAHMDLKPENILVEWQKVDVAPSPGEEDKPVGVWMITDFGISILRRSSPHTGTNAFGLRPIHDNHGPKRASVSPPRGAGPFAAPEMATENASTVNEFSDMWSFGCILAMLLAFILGGPDKAGELYQCRVRGYSDDYFYTGSDEENPRLKPEVHEWLTSQSKLPQSSNQQEWVHECQKLILDLLKIDRDSRISAKKTGKALFEIRSLTEQEKLPWSPPANNPFINPEHEYPIPRLGSVASVCSATSEDQAGTVGTERQSQEDQLAKTQSRVGRRPPSSDQLSLAFAKLTVPPNTVYTSLSPKGSLVVFVGPESVFLYELKRLSKVNDFWSADYLHAKTVPQAISPRFFHEVFAKSGQHWKSAMISGSFVALLSRASDDKDISATITVYDRASHHDSSAFPQEARQIKIAEGFKEVRLSSKGALLAMFSDHMDFYPDTASTTINLSLPSKFQKCAFTNDGRWLCVWFTNVDSHSWEIFDTASLDQVSSATCEVPIDKEETSNFRKDLIPLNNEPSFFAYDQHGNAFFIRRDEHKAVQVFLRACTGAVRGAASSNGKALAVVREVQGSLKHEASYASTLNLDGTGNFQLKRWVEFDRDYDGFHSGTCIANSDAGTFLIISHLDGSLVKRRLPEDSALGNTERSTAEWTHRL